MAQDEQGSPPPLPETLTIEPIVGCNLRCPVCYVGNGLMQRDRMLMTLSQFRHVASEIEPFAKRIYLHCWGEPMLHPDIVEMIRIASRFAHVNISTNGQNMTPDLAREMIKAGVYDVIVSIDGANQETYEKYRVGGELSKALNALSYLHAARKESGTNTVLIFQTVVTKFNESQLEELRATCDRMGGVRFSEKTLFGLDQGVGDHLLPVASEYRRFARARKISPKECRVPWSTATIYADGSVVPCCYDYNAKIVLGNALKESFQKIWSGPAFARFRQDLTEGKTAEYCSPICGKTEPPRPRLRERFREMVKRLLVLVLPRSVAPADLKRWCMHALRIAKAGKREPGSGDR